MNQVDISNLLVAAGFTRPRAERLIKQGRVLIDVHNPPIRLFVVNKLWPSKPKGVFESDITIRIRKT